MQSRREIGDDVPIEPRRCRLAPRARPDLAKQRNSVEALLAQDLPSKEFSHVDPGRTP